MKNKFVLYVVATRPDPAKIAYDKAYYDPHNAFLLKESLDKLHGAGTFKVYKIKFSKFEEINPEQQDESNIAII